MRRAILFLIVAAVVIAVAWWVSDLPGFVSISIGSTVFEARSSAAIGCAVVAFVVLYLLVRIVLRIFATPRAVGRWRREQRRARGDRAVTHTLLALAAGENSDARRDAGRARRLLGNTPQTLLLTAEAARAAGDEAGAEEAYRTLSEQDDAPFLGYRGLLRLSMERKDWVAAARYARLAEASHPGAAWLRGERRQLAVMTGNWSEALTLTDAEAPKAALATAAAEAESDPSRARRFAKQAWTEAPGNPAAALAYARRLRQAGSEKRALAVIQRTWEASPHPDLAAFALARTASNLARVQAVKRLTASNPEHPESRLLMARAYLDAGLAGEARHQAEAVREAGISQRRVWSLLADIDEALGNETGARDALRRVSPADPDPDWYCENCGAPASGWVPVCATCNEVGRIAWGRSRRQMVLPPPSAAPTAAMATPAEEPALAAAEARAEKAA
jgi:HemY protein